MREDVVRKVITRLLTDQEFLSSVKQTPGKVLAEYGLSQDELAAISAVDSGDLGIGRLESRISAASISPIHRGGDDDPPECGCVNVSPRKCK